MWGRMPLLQADTPVKADLASGMVWGWKRGGEMQNHISLYLVYRWHLKTSPVDPAGLRVQCQPPVQENKLVHAWTLTSAVWRDYSFLVKSQTLLPGLGKVSNPQYLSSISMAKSLELVLPHNWIDIVQQVLLHHWLCPHPSLAELYYNPLIAGGHCSFAFCMQKGTEIFLFLTQGREWGNWNRLCRQGKMTWGCIFVRI